VITLSDFHWTNIDKFQISKPSIKTDVIIYEEDLKNEEALEAEKFNEVIQPIQEMDI